jgi:hypothetical protein
MLSRHRETTAVVAAEPESEAPVHGLYRLSPAPDPEPEGEPEQAHEPDPDPEPEPELAEVRQLRLWLTGDR